MANASSASTYEIFQIEKNGRTVVVTGEVNGGASVTSLDYYESLLSPNITAVMSVFDGGSTVDFDEKYDNQGRGGTLSSALPLTGDVNVRFKITSNWIDDKTGQRRVLDFSNKPLSFVEKYKLDQQSGREGIFMSLVSKSAKDNQENVVKEKYSGNIGDTVKKLVKQYLNQQVAITPTKNSKSFNGYSESVFDIIMWLASQSAPADETYPGYFFYETQRGFNFKSIDDLITQPPVEEYFFNEVMKSGLKDDQNNYKIQVKTDLKSEDLLTMLKSGVFQTRQITLNLKDRTCKTVVYKFDELKKSLGKEVDAPKTGGFARTLFDIKSVGTHEKTPAGEVDNDPEQWKVKAIMRYNLLFSQIMHIQVPCNLNLTAGDTIVCNFETITKDSKDQGVPDPVQSGKYLILNLCHHFDSKRSITSLTLVRDSYGLYTNKNKK